MKYWILFQFRGANQNSSQDLESSWTYRRSNNSREDQNTSRNRSAIFTEGSSLLAHISICVPIMRIDILESGEIDDLVRESNLVVKYNQSTDREGKFELLQKKMIAVEVKQKKSLFPLLTANL
jgi:hypothetical protein